MNKLCDNMTAGNILNSIETVFNIEMDNADEAEIVYNSISPEVSFARNDRSKTEIELEGKNIVFKIIQSSIILIKINFITFIFPQCFLH